VQASSRCTPSRCATATKPLVWAIPLTHCSDRCLPQARAQPILRPRSAHPHRVRPHMSRRAVSRVQPCALTPSSPPPPSPHPPPLPHSCREREESAFAVRAGGDGSGPTIPQPFHLATEARAAVRSPSPRPHDGSLPATAPRAHYGGQAGHGYHAVGAGPGTTAVPIGPAIMVRAVPTAASASAALAALLDDADGNDGFAAPPASHHHRTTASYPAVAPVVPAFMVSSKRVA